MFKIFNETPDAAGFLSNQGKMVDARWTKKNNNTFYSYKNQLKADTKTELIEEFIVTDDNYVNKKQGSKIGF